MSCSLYGCFIKCSSSVIRRVHAFTMFSAREQCLNQTLDSLTIMDTYRPQNSNIHVNIGAESD